MTPQELAERWATLPPDIWLAGVTGRDRHDVVIGWSRQPDGLTPLPCGVRWDALRMPEELGLTMLKVLRETDARPALGPVLHDRRGGLTYWLLPIETDAGAYWRDIDPTLRLLSLGSHLACPEREPEMPRQFPARWLFWPAVTGTLTPPDLLAAAVRQALALEGL